MPSKSSPVDRFWSRVDQSVDCWIWTGRCNDKGYGVIDIGGLTRPKGRPVLAHRFSYEIAFGTFPDELHVCHKCDNPPCVRPDHLFLGTNDDNRADSVAKGRQARGEMKHRALTEAKVREIRQRVTYGERQMDIAAELGVSRGVISEVCSRRAWAHVN